MKSMSALMRNSANARNAVNMSHSTNVSSILNMMMVVGLLRPVSCSGWTIQDTGYRVLIALRQLDPSSGFSDELAKLALRHSGQVDLTCFGRLVHTRLGLVRRLADLAASTCGANTETRFAGYPIRILASLIRIGAGFALNIPFHKVLAERKRIGVCRTIPLIVQYVEQAIVALSHYVNRIKDAIPVDALSVVHFVLLVACRFTCLCFCFQCIYFYCLCLLRDRNKRVGCRVERMFPHSQSPLSPT